MQTIISASGQPNIDEVVSHIDGYKVIDVVEYKNKLVETIEKQIPDILVVGETLGGREPLSSLLLKIKMSFPSIRIIYFCGELDYRDTVKNNTVGNLAYLGVYDIIDLTNIASEGIEVIIKNPRTEESVAEIIERVRDSSHTNKKNHPIEVLFSEDKILGEDGQIIKNLHLFMSPKGGTGTSFVAFNTAVAIAEKGITKDGKKPRVCLLDFDLEGYNLGTFLNIRKKEMNLMDISNELKLIITESGNIDADEEDMHRVIDMIKKSVKTVEGVDILTGNDSNYSQQDLSKLRGSEISFIIEVLHSEYDVIIADSKSDIEYETLYPLLFLSRNIYSVLDMNYNTLGNNKFLKDYFQSMGVSHKFKYVLNQYFDHEDLKLRAQDIESEGNINFSAKIPELNSLNFLNYLYSGKSVFRYSDEFEFVKQSFYVLADDLWRIQDIETVKKKIKKTEEFFNKQIDETIAQKDTFFYERIDFFSKLKDSDVEANDKSSEPSDEPSSKRSFLSFLKKDK